MAVKELCLMLCPCRDTLLDVSTRYLWVQGDQWFRGGLNDQVWTEDERNPVDCKIKTKTKLRNKEDTCYSLYTQGHTV